MLNYTHYIQLIPLGKYFFGGENYASKDQKAFYFQHSRDFPQQTSVLGLLRHQLLIQNPKILGRKNGRDEIIDEMKAIATIGAEGFRSNNPTASFGVIKGLSPVFLSDAQGKKFIPSIKNKTWSADKTHIEKKDIVFGTPLASKGFFMHEYVLEKVPLLESFNPKLGFQPGFKELGGTLFREYGDIFSSLEAQIGINKSQTLRHRRDLPQSEKEGFYKMTYKQLQPGYGFSFYAELSDLKLLKLKLASQAMVVFGKERSAFRMLITPLTPKDNPIYFQDPVPTFQGGDELLLASDAKLDPSEVYPYCEAVISTSESFRSMKTETKASYNYYGNPRSRGSGKPSLSDRYNLMQRGSILKLKSGLTATSIQKLRPKLESPIFTRIGYNYFLKR